MIQPEPSRSESKDNLKAMILDMAGKREDEISDEERKMLEENVDALADFTGGIADLAMPGLEAIAADVSDAKRKVNELQTFCEKLESVQIEYQKKVAQAFLLTLDAIEGKVAIHPTWRDNLRKQAGL